MSKTLIIFIGISFFMHSCKKDKKVTSQEDTLEIGLISHFKLDGNAADLKGVNNGSMNGTTSVLDRKGNLNGAISFDGIDDDIRFSNANLYFDNFTYSIWYKPIDMPQSGSAYYFIAFGSAGSDHNLLLANYYGASYGICGGSYNDPNNINQHTLVVPGNEPLIGDWNFIVLTRDDKNLKLYVNSKLLKTSSVNDTKPKYARSSSDLLTIGSRGGQFYTKGILDDVRIYDRAISESEVSMLYVK
jgi:hypothetical protein